MDNISFRAVKDTDLKGIVHFLVEEGMLAAESDWAGVGLLLQKNPGLSQLAESDGKIIGTVLCSFDGLRGYLNKLVVSKEHRSGGVGRKLIMAAETRLRELNCPEMMIMCHPYLAKWYEGQGFSKVDSLVYRKEFKTSGNSPDCD